ncbi:uncharacterized protein LOC131625688 [Vicia villosa]|uniref:uncharacterized protein LOC131622430 n=1 Tax=Vicia villosa TaxID=3911 RepID=UPI00273B1DDD|nr:uncharacterized protein LOC131622430 [Vicia villosa]XP_058752508.1 uncharacterized protein LOC131625688 [Vicia villosa]
MGFTSKTISFTLALTLTLASFLFVGNAEPSEDIHVVNHNLRSDLTALCQKTTNPKLCLDTIQPHLLKGVITPIKALDAEVDATHDQTVKTMDVIGTSLAKHSVSKSLKDSLAICKEQYQGILDTIKETKQAIANNDLSTAKLKFSSVLSYQGSCKDAFEGMEKEFSFSHDSDAVFQLGGNCLDIIADMEKAMPKPEVPTEPAPSTATTFSNVIGTIS